MPHYGGSGLARIIPSQSGDSEDSVAAVQDAGAPGSGFLSILKPKALGRLTWLRDDRIRNLTIHPDGKRIAFSRGGVLGEIWTMRNIVPQERLAAK